jgi:hypothetical protein
MRKIAILLLLAFILTIAGTAGVWGVVPGYENSISYKKIANYTLEFLHANGMGGTGTFSIYESSRYTDDEVIEKTLKSCWTMNETYIRRITHVNGVPIENTKWAKYGGVIQHVGGNYQFPTDPAEPVEEPVATEVTVFINQKQVEFPDQKAIIIWGRTMVPIRALSESLDFQVDWVAEERKVEIKEKLGNKRKLLSPEEWAAYLHKGGNS